jgi:hypothetical protein
VSEQELITQCFYYLNSFKRHRALQQIKALEGNRTEAQYHELKQYQFMDSLELGLRAIQKNQRSIGEENNDRD